MSEALALVPPDLPAVHLADVAADLLSEHRIVQTALPPLVARVLADPDLERQALDALIAGECRRQLEKVQNERHQAEKRRTGGGPLGQARSADLSGWAGAVQTALLDGFVLPGGKRLGDAERGDLGRALEAFKTVSADASVKARWMRLLQQSVPPGKRVRDVLSETRVAELRAEARKACEE